MTKSILFYKEFIPGKLKCQHVFWQGVNPDSPCVYGETCSTSLNYHDGSP